MKKTITILTIISIVKLAFTQQPSLNFETWNPPPFGWPHPQGWTSANIIGSGLNDTVCHKASAPNVNSGSFAMKLETIKLGFNLGVSSGLPDTVCFAFTGNIVANPSLSIKPGFAFTGRPSVLSYYYKYLPTGLDSATAGVFLTKWTGISRDTVAFGYRYMGTSQGFIHDSVALTYTSAYALSGNPDSALIFFASSQMKSISISSAGVLNIKYNLPKIGSMLWIDDIGLSPLSLEETDENSNFSLFPIPSNESLNINFKDNSERSIQILNASGAEIDNLKLTDKNLIINTSKYFQGVYFIRVKNANGLFTTKRFVVTH